MYQNKLFTFSIVFIFTTILCLTFFSCSRSSKIAIGIVGDQFGSYNSDNSYEIMDRTINKINAYNPDILLHVGDIVESIRDINTFEAYQENFKTAISIMNNSGVPWLIAVGDHDVVPIKYQPCSNDRSREKWFMDCCKQYQTPLKDCPYYSKDLKGYHFISLYSLENLHTDPRWGPIFLNKINQDQITWLKSDLEDNKNTKGIIVLVHHPHWYVWSNWQEIHELLRNYPVIAVIAGHYHYDQDDGMIDGIRYLVMGSSGGVVKDTDAHSGGVQEYEILNIKGRKITDIQLREVESDSLLELSPRRSMDRIQAVSCMLDNLWNNVQINRKDGKIIVQNNNALTKNQIGLTSLANPIDIPIQIQINYPVELLINPVWNREDSIIVANCPIQLNPGERIGWANYSNVGQWFPPNPLWQAEINPESEIFNTINLSVIVKFQDTRQRFIRRSLTFPVN